MRAYKIVMMNKHEIKIDEDEVQKVIQAIGSNSPAILKQAIFNPSSYSHIVEDTDREKTQDVDELGRYTGKYIFKKLPDIFNKITLIADRHSVNDKGTYPQLN